MISERGEILKALRAGPIILRRLVRDLPDDATRARPAPGEWAIVEVVAHLADTEERLLARTRRMLGETDFLHGDDGNDALDGGPNKDTCDGGINTDTAIRCEQLLGVP